MKRFGIMIAAATALIVAAGPMSASAQGRNRNANAAPPPITKEQREQGMAGAPAAVQAAKATCTVADAYLINSVTDAKTKAKTDYFEVACNEGLGYVVQNGVEPKAFNCLAINEAAAADAAAGKAGGVTCRLQANMDPKQGLGAMLRTAGRACTVTNARAMGATPQGEEYFEAACEGGRGYVIQTGAPGSGTATTALDCAQFIGGQTECQLTTKQQIVASIGQMASQGGRNCAVSDARFVGIAGQSTFYEVACGTDAGFMIEANATGAFQRAIECTRAQTIAGGCTLSNTQAAETAEIATYTRLAKAANFNCDVSKYRFLGVDQKSNAEVVELACGNRGDGAIALFPTQASGKAQVFDCVQGGSVGVACQLTQANQATFDKYTAGLASRGRNTCKVSNAKYLASTESGGDLIETACADGLPGYVLVVDHATGAARDLLTCRDARASGAACTFPTNQTAAAAR